MEVVLLFAILLLTIVLLYGKLNHRAKKMEAAELNIKDLTLNVKDQLEEIDSIREQRNEFPLFTIESFDLELNFIIKRSEKENATFKNELITISGEQDYSKEQVQKIVLHMRTTAPNFKINGPISNK